MTLSPGIPRSGLTQWCQFEIIIAMTLPSWLPELCQWLGNTPGAWAQHPATPGSSPWSHHMCYNSNYPPSWHGPDTVSTHEILRNLFWASGMSFIVPYSTMSVLHLLDKCWNVILRIKQCTTKQQMSIPFNKWIMFVNVHTTRQFGDKKMAPLIQESLVNIGVLNWFRKFEIDLSWIINVVERVWIKAGCQDAITLL